jgi:hypothetical protein
MRSQPVQRASRFDKHPRDYCDFALEALAIAEELNPEPIERVSGCRCTMAIFSRGSSASGSKTEAASNAPLLVVLTPPTFAACDLWLRRRRIARTYASPSLELPS